MIAEGGNVVAPAAVVNPLVADEFNLKFSINIK
jgi:hypothetical protein